MTIRAQYLQRKQSGKLKSIIVGKNNITEIRDIGDKIKQAAMN